MTTRSPASPNPRWWGASLPATFLAAVVMMLLGGSSARAQSAELMAAADGPPAGSMREIADPYADRFPNVVLKTHEGNNVRFYEDLLKGKIVLINFMYATCKER